MTDLEYHNIAPGSVNAQLFIRLTPGDPGSSQSSHALRLWGRKDHSFRTISQALLFLLGWTVSDVAGGDMCLPALVDVDLLVLSFRLCLPHLPLKTCWSGWLMWASHTRSLWHTLSLSRLGVGVGGSREGDTGSWKSPQMETKPLTRSEFHFKTRVPWALPASALGQKPMCCKVHFCLFRCRLWFVRTSRLEIRQRSHHSAWAACPTLA